MHYVIHIHMWGILKPCMKLNLNQQLRNSGKAVGPGDLAGQRSRKVTIPVDLNVKRHLQLELYEHVNVPFKIICHT